TRRDLRGSAFVGHAELGQVVAQGRVEVEQAVVDELHDEGGGPDLGDRSDLEHAVGSGVDVRRRAQHAGGGVDDLTVLEDGDGGAGNAPLSGESGEVRVEEDGDVGK